MLLDHTYGLLNLLESKCNVFDIVYFKQNMNLKIQMLAGKEAKTYFEFFFKNLLSLVMEVLVFLSIYYKVNKVASKTGKFYTRSRELQ